MFFHMFLVDTVTLSCLSPVVVVLSLLQLVDVSPLQQQFLFLDDQQRAADSSSVCVDSDLTLSDISDHRHLKHLEPGTLRSET